MGPDGQLLAEAVRQVCWEACWAMTATAARADLSLLALCCCRLMLCDAACADQQGNTRAVPNLQLKALRAAAV